MNKVRRPLRATHCIRLAGRFRRYSGGLTLCNSASICLSGSAAVVMAPEISDPADLMAPEILNPTDLILPAMAKVLASLALPISLYFDLMASHSSLKSTVVR